MPRRDLNRALCFILAGGNIFFGLIALLFTGRTARIMGETPQDVRAIARKDLGLGLLVVIERKPRWSLLVGIGSDLLESVNWLRVKRREALVPALWTAMGVLAFLTRN